MAASEHIGRRRDPTPAKPQRRPLAAAARKVNLTDKAQVKRETNTRDWHERAWRIAGQVGEIKYAIGYFGNLMAKLRIFAAVQIGDEHDATYVPVSALLEARAHPADADEALLKVVDRLEELGYDWELGSTAVNEVRRFRSVYGGQSELLRRMAGNLEIAGECWVIGMDVDDGDGPVETWEVLSNRAVRTKPEDARGRLWWFRDRNDREGTPIEAGTAWKIWLPDLEYHMEPDALIRGVLDDAETLHILTGQVKAESRSRHPAGLLLLPNELSTGTADPTAGDEQGSEDPFLDDLEEAILAPVIDPDDAGSVFPTVIRGPGDVLDKIKHIPLARTTDEVLEARIQARVERCARGLNMPVEVVLGHQQTTYANADQVDEDTYTKHLDPRAVLIAQALTFGFLHPQLRAAGFDPLDYSDGPVRTVVWYDPSALVRKADPEESANDLFDKFAISFKALRQVKGFSEDDAPTDQELALRLLLTNRGQLDVAVVEGLLAAVIDTPIDIERPEPPAIGPAPEDPDDEPAGDAEAVAAALVRPFLALVAATQGLDAGGGVPALGAGSSEVVESHAASLPPAEPRDTHPEGPPPFTEAVTAAGRVPLGRVLLEIDRETRAAVWASAEAATTTVMEKAGIRAKNYNRQIKAVAASLDLPLGAYPRALAAPLVAAGATAADLVPDEAFDHMEATFKRWVDEAGSTGLDRIEEATSGFSVADREHYQLRHLTDRDEAWTWLRSSLLTNARGRLFSPDDLDAADLAGLGEDTGTLVTPGIVRAAMARAGGNRLETDGESAFVTAAGKPPAGVATGPTAMEAAAAKGLAVEAYRWDYGLAPRARPFEPHKNLHGKVFADFNDDALLKGAGRTWPPFDHYFPGDHKGCICDAEPVLVGPDGQVVADDQPDVVDQPTVPAASPPPPAKPRGPKLSTMFDAKPDAQLKAARRVFGHRHGDLTATVTDARRRTHGRTGLEVLKIEGEITDADGRVAGWFEREIVRRADGTYEVHHNFLELEKRAQGKGFASAWNAENEAWYRANGVAEIKLEANIDVGGYTWAKAGYDWDYPAAQDLPADLGKIRTRLRSAAKKAGMAPEDFEPMLARLDRANWGSSDYPSPRDIAEFGRTPGADTWPGKQALLGSTWKGRKAL